MADSFINPQFAKADQASVYPLSTIRVLVYGTGFATLILMAIGSATRVTNAGLSCPDWPLCYGTLIPSDQMNLQVFLEWFHRLVASSIGLVMVCLTTTCWYYRRLLPGWLPLSITFSLGLIVLQGILGGLTVTQLLRFDIVTAHLATGLLFFCSMVTIGGFLQPYQGTGVTGNLYWYSSVAAVCVYLQSVLGAVVASRWAVHRCIDGSQLCQVLHGHMLSAIPVGLSILVLVFKAWRVPALHPGLRRLLQLASGLLLLQVLVGLSTLRLQLRVEWLTISHQAIAALLFGTLVSFSVIALRDRWQADHQLFAVPFPRSLRSSVRS
jgi:heme a synthase